MFSTILDKHLQNSSRFGLTSPKKDSELDP